MSITRALKAMATGGVLIATVLALAAPASAGINLANGLELDNGLSLGMCYPSATGYPSPRDHPSASALPRKT